MLEKARTGFEYLSRSQLPPFHIADTESEPEHIDDISDTAATTKARAEIEAKEKDEEMEEEGDDEEAITLFSDDDVVPFEMDEQPDEPNVNSSGPSIPSAEEVPISRLAALAIFEATYSSPPPCWELISL